MAVLLKGWRGAPSSCRWCPLSIEDETGSKNVCVYLNHAVFDMDERNENCPLQEVHFPELEEEDDIPINLENWKKDLITKQAAIDAVEKGYMAIDKNGIKMCDMDVAIDQIQNL